MSRRAVADSFWCEIARAFALHHPRVLPFSGSMKRFLVLCLFACGSVDPKAESVVASELPAPGCYLLTAPLVCPADGCPRGCSAVVVTRALVASDDSVTVDTCPRGWSCSHDAAVPLGAVYDAVLPKSPGTVCSYDAAIGTLEAPPPEMADHGGCD